jgi:deoxycytidylate deaminase
MASVSRCDSCGAVVAHEDCTIIKMLEETASGKARTLKCTVEACSSCTKKIMEMFNNGSEQR